ncbi:MAG: hypothetical protein MJ127_01950 [Mogibacterium sp.]|nr:hypothetical protein [Mogibacterium sp.]
MLIIAFITSVLLGNKSWKEIIENIKGINLKAVGYSVGKVIVWAAVIVVALLVIFRLAKVAFWIALLGFAVSLIKTLITEHVIKR